MKGMFFAHLGPDSDQPGRVNIRTGHVKQAVGADRYLLEFKGKNYRFAQVFNSEQLQAFSFFDTEAGLEAFIAEIMASSVKAGPPADEAPESPEV
jgi:hypothetical protein